MTSDATPGTGEGTPALHIGEVAARTELSLRTLRHYDEIGLLRPSARTGGGHRLYTEADVEKILVIRRMKPLGFTLDEMSEAMRDIETLHASGQGKRAAAEAHRRLAGILEDATERRQRLEHQLAMADEFIDILGRQLGRAGPPTGQESRSRSL